MTEKEWRECGDLRRMLAFLRPCFSLSKAYFLAVACDRRMAPRYPRATYSVKYVNEAYLLSSGPIAEHHDSEYLIDSLLMEVLGLTGCRPGNMWVACTLLRDLFNPFQHFPFDPAWCTPAVMGLAKTFDAQQSLDCLPVLANALVDAGCNEVSLLEHLRNLGTHIRGCWALHLILRDR
jgi:hypothetical protein